MASKLSNLYHGQWTVYALIDPRDSIVYYVGCTTDLKHRVGLHARDCLSHNLPVHLWLRDVLDSNNLPIIKVLEQGKGLGIHALAKERSWIDKFRAENPLLKNVIRNENLIGIPRSDEVKAVLSRKLMGHEVSVETRKRMSDSAKKSIRPKRTLEQLEAQRQRWEARRQRKIDELYKKASRL